MRPLVPLALLALAACRSPGSSAIPEARADETPAPEGVAVVELFTSEGCSSCPAADAVLGALASRPHVFALAFHVDYWDDLGWPDRLASPEYTARQRDYARSFATRSVFTPQMIVGGTEGFTGSDRDRADTAIARALARPAAVRLSLRARAVSADTVEVTYDTSGSPGPGSVLDVAVVERATSTDVRAGENAGRSLHHTNVVRGFASPSLTSPSGTVPVHVPRALRPQDALIIAYVQRPSSDAGGMAIVGAAASHVGP